MRIGSGRTDRDMEGIFPHLTARMFLSFLPLILLQTSAEAQSICSGPLSVNVPENAEVGHVVVTITREPGVTLSFKPPPANPDNPFRLEENKLITAGPLDHETTESHIVEIICTQTTASLRLDFRIIVFVDNVNDEPPVFNQNPYHINVNELSPPGTSVGRFDAIDVDSPVLYYTLTPESSGFNLKSPTDPDLVVVTLLDFDKVKKVELTLTAQDTPFEPPSTPSFSATTTIIVTIQDIDNRPPWFQPCTQQEIGGALICLNSGYTGTVVLNEQEAGVLPLKPGPLYAIDGDLTLNEAITYTFLNGNDDGLFEIDPDTGNIRMLKPADVLGTINLTVLAAQKTNAHQFATTTVAISVHVKSLHPPKFQSPQYEGVITTAGAMAMDKKNKDQPLHILATDDDYAATGGLNPHITYSIKGDSDFTIINGYLFMTKDLPDAIKTLEVVATDPTNDELDTAQLTVEVISGLSTTSLPPSTTEATTEDIMSTIVSTTASSSVSTASTNYPHTVIIPSGDYGPADMAAVGVTLGVLLFTCLVVIGVLACRIQKGKADWKKIYETSMFRSSLGQGSGGKKGGIQYTNDGFQNDEDGGSVSSGDLETGSVTADTKIQKMTLGSPINDAIPKSQSQPLYADPDDITSQAGSDRSDESEMKPVPILTKERRTDEGYKSVWFKEDIDPNAKEEVVIIPDSRHDDSEEEDGEQSSREREDDEDEDEDEDDNAQKKTPRVMFRSDADLDSGLSMKMEDPAEDSEGDETLNIDL